MARSFASCSWCHEMNETTVELCKSCGHQAHVARMNCACSMCRGNAELATAPAPTMWRFGQGAIIDFNSPDDVTIEGNVITVDVRERFQRILDKHCGRAESAPPPDRGEDD